MLILRREGLGIRPRRLRSKGAALATRRRGALSHSRTARSLALEHSDARADTVLPRPKQGVLSVSFRGEHRAQSTREVLRVSERGFLPLCEDLQSSEDVSRRAPLQLLSRRRA